jgi:ABC-type phosphate/phosphonate transport system permease subunit
MSFDWPRGSRGALRLGTDLPPGEFKRLGRPGAYRLGLLRAQGISVRRLPTPFRARFARHRDHRWSAQVWLLGLLASVAVIAAATAMGWSFVPLLAGLAAGLANRPGGWPPRVALPAVAGMAAAGWLVPFLLPTVPGSAGGALARTAGTLTGMPSDAVGVAALTTAIAVIQALAGYCLVSAFTRDDQVRSR